MKKNVFLALAVAGLSASVTGSALAERCPSLDTTGPAATINRVLMETVTTNGFRSYRDSEYYRHHDLEVEDWEDRGVDSVSVDSNSEFQQHVLAALLVQGGVKDIPPPIIFGPAPSIPGNPTVYHYDPNPDLDEIPTFHSSFDYGALASDHKWNVCTAVNIATGARHCTNGKGHSVKRKGLRGAFGARKYTDWGRPNVTGARNESNLYPDWAAALWRWRSWFSNPNWEIRYFCDAFNSIVGPVFTASAIVHENGHGARTKGHARNNRCDGDFGCAKYNYDIPMATTRYGELALIVDEMDSYQLHQHYSCDMADSSADWVPLIVQKAFYDQAGWDGDRTVFHNTPGQVRPFDCGAPAEVMAYVYEPPPTTCDDGSAVCSDDADCGTGFECDSGCCAQLSSCPSHLVCTIATNCSVGENCVSGCCQTACPGSQACNDGSTCPGGACDSGCCPPVIK